MTRRLPASSFALVVLLVLANAARAQNQNQNQDQAGAGPAPSPDAAATATGTGTGSGTETGKAGAAETQAGKARPGQPQLATFGGGCFWCTEAVFERVPGVINVVSGYAGGSVAFPNYALVSAGMTGHAEVVQVLFNPAMVSYETLLEVFWRSHDPTTPNAQGPDVGTQYRSIILYHDDEQKKAAEKVYRALKTRRVLRGKVVTELVPYRGFFPAEPYHQDYYNNHPADPYSIVYIAPKFDVFRKIAKGSQKKTAGKEKGKGK